MDKQMNLSACNDEILNQIISDLSIADDVADISHKGSTSLRQHRTK